MLKRYYDIELEDDNRVPWGGTSFMGETVEDFITDIGYTGDSLEELNEILSESGIKILEELI